MPVRHKPGSKPCRDQLRASLSAMGAHGLRHPAVAGPSALAGAEPRLLTVNGCRRLPRWI
jgi:hypothetical protein